MNRISLQDLNAASPARFVEALGDLFEHAPWVAQRALDQRPFGSRAQLHQALCAVVMQATTSEQLALIRAHPELGLIAHASAQLTAASTREQRGAGLATCTPAQAAELAALNQAYRARFGFPFIIAVRGHTPASLIEALTQRLTQDSDTEQATALTQIFRIARFRLCDRVSAPLGPEILAVLDELAAFSETEHGLTCTYLSQAHRQCAAHIGDWMLAAGLAVHHDAVGNVVGRLRGTAASASSLLTGSHYDTVIDAGKYDGRLGIVLPILVALELRQQGLALPYDLEIIAFAEEEGVRFNLPYLGSRAVAGRFDEQMLEIRDAQGTTLRAALQQAGLEPAAIAACARDPKALLGYVEVHIEQGPVLLETDQALGVVSAIAGAARHRLSVYGQGGHAGTVPMALRHDAAVAAAQIVLAVEARCAQVPQLVGTVGCLEIPGGAINVIPARCELSLDVRAAEDAVRDAALVDIQAAIQRIAQARGVRIEMQALMQTPATPCDPALQRQLSASISRVSGEPAPPHLLSGAGHDAVMMASLTAIGMLFVRCGNAGISHHPGETLSAADAELAAQVFTDFLCRYVP